MNGVWQVNFYSQQIILYESVFPLSYRVPDIKIKNGWKTRRHKRDLKAFDLESYNTYPSVSVHSAPNAVVYMVDKSFTLDYLHVRWA